MPLRYWRRARRVPSLGQVSTPADPNQPPSFDKVPPPAAPPTPQGYGPVGMPGYAAGAPGAAGAAGYGQGAGVPAGYGQPSPYGPANEDSTLAVLVHLSIFVFALVGPLVVYLISKDDPAKQMTRWHAAEALNFHLTLTIAMFVSFILIFVLIGIVLVFGLMIWAAVLGVIAAVAASRREPYRYPATFRFVH